MASSSITSWQTDEEIMETVTGFILLGSKITADGDHRHEIKKHLGKTEKPRWHIKKQSHHFADKGPHSPSFGFSNSHVWIWELDYRESWIPKNRWFWTMVLEKTLECVLDSKEFKEVNPKENQSWIFIGRSDAEVEAPIPWSPNGKSWLIGRDPDSKKDWGEEEEGTTVEKMVEWHCELNGQEFEQTPGGSEGQGSLVCCNHGISKSWTQISNWTTIKDSTSCNK